MSAVLVVSVSSLWSSRGVVLADSHRPNGGIRCSKALQCKADRRELRQAEKIQAQGLTIPQTCKRLGISRQTFYRWRIKYGALKEGEAQRFKALERENARLKRIVAVRTLVHSRCCDLEAAAAAGLLAAGLSGRLNDGVVDVRACGHVAAASVAEPTCDSRALFFVIALLPREVAYETVLRTMWWWSPFSFEKEPRKLEFASESPAEPSGAGDRVAVGQATGTFRR